MLDHAGHLSVWANTYTGLPQHSQFLREFGHFYLVSLLAKYCKFWARCFDYFCHWEIQPVSQRGMVLSHSLAIKQRDDVAVLILSKLTQ